MHDCSNDPILGKALAYWRRKRGDRMMPARRDVDPTEIPSLLPHLQLIEVCDGPRFRYRLVGTSIVEAFGQDYTGKFVDEQFAGDRRRFIEEIYKTVCAERRPMFLRNKYTTARNVDMVASRLYLPLAADGEHVDIILGACIFDFGGSTLAGGWGSATRQADRYQFEPV